MNGDLQGKVQRVQRELQQLKYTNTVDDIGLRLGDPVALLPLLHFTLLKFSRHVAQCIHKAGYELQGKTDQKFVENSFRLFRDCFNIKTVLTPANFLEQGFAERKLLLVSDVIQACKKIHNDEIRKERLAALKHRQGPGVESRLYQPTHKTPEVKIVKGGQEVRQVVQAQHLQNGSDGGQSVYKVKKVVASSPSIGPGKSTASRSRGVTENAGNGTPASTARAPPQPQQASADAMEAYTSNAGPIGSPLELTLKPHGAPGGVLGALSTPIHSWFMNPTYRDTTPERDGAGAAAGVGQQPAAKQPWWMDPAAVAAGAGASAAAAGTSSGAQWWAAGASLGSSLTFPALGNEQDVEEHGDHEGDIGDNDVNAGLQQLLTHVQGAGAGAWGQQGALQVVDVQPVAEVVVDASAEEQEEGEDGSGSEAANWLNTAQVSAAPTATRHLPAHHPSPLGATQLSQMQGRHVHAYPQQLQAHQPSPQTQCTLGTSASPSTTKPGGLGVVGLQAGTAPTTPMFASLETVSQLDDRLWAAERQLLTQLSELQTRVKQLEDQALEERAAAERQSQAQQARLTVLEGRVRFLECELDGCVRRGEYLAPPHAPAAGGVGSPGLDKRPGAAHSSPSGSNTQQQQTQQQQTQQQHEQAVGFGQQTWNPNDITATKWGAPAPSEQSDSTSRHAHMPGSLHHPTGPSESNPATRTLYQSSVYAKAAHPRDSLNVAHSMARVPEAPTPSFVFQPSTTAAVTASSATVLRQHVAATQEALSRAAAPPAAAPGTSSSSTISGGELAAGRSNAGASAPPSNTHAPPSFMPSTSVTRTYQGPVSTFSGQQKPAPAAALHKPARGSNQEHPPENPPNTNLTELYAPRRASAAVATVHAQRPAAAAAPPAPGAGSNTSDLINSLFARYTEADTFLAGLRKSSGGGALH